MIAVQEKIEEIKEMTSAAIAEILQEYNKTAKVMELKLNEVAKEKELWIKDKELLLQQNTWLSEENGRLIDHNVQLTQEKSELLRANAELLKNNTELMEAAKVSTRDQILLQELQKAHAKLQEEKEAMTRKLNPLEEKIGTSDELQKSFESLAEEIQSLTTQKNILVEEIGSLTGNKDRLAQENDASDLEKWVKSAVGLALVFNGSVKDGEKVARRIIDRMPDAAKHSNILNLYEYVENNNGNRSKK